MKKVFKYILIAGLTLGFTSCDKFFDNMEGDLSKVAADDLLQSENGLLAMLANLYSSLPGMSMSDNDKYQMFGNGARENPDYKNTTPGFWDYKSVRAVNKFLEAVEESYQKGMFDENAKKAYEGEGLFIRACYYFANVRTHGGIPIVTESLDKYYGVENDKLYVPRSTEKDSWDWVLDQFQQAADEDGSDDRAVTLGGANGAGGGDVGEGDAGHHGQSRTDAPRAVQLQAGAEAGDQQARLDDRRRLRGIHLRRGRDDEDRGEVRHEHRHHMLQAERNSLPERHRGIQGGQRLHGNAAFLFLLSHCFLSFLTYGLWENCIRRITGQHAGGFGDAGTSVTECDLTGCGIHGIDDGE